MAVPGTKFQPYLSEMPYLPAYLVSWLSVLMNEEKNPNCQFEACFAPTYSEVVIQFVALVARCATLALMN